jgi:hypothetical protein
MKPSQKPRQLKLFKDCIIKDNEWWYRCEDYQKTGKDYHCKFYKCQLCTFEPILPDQLFEI